MTCRPEPDYATHPRAEETVSELHRWVVGALSILAALAALDWMMG